MPQVIRGSLADDDARRHFHESQNAATRSPTSSQERVTRLDEQEQQQQQSSTTTNPLTSSASHADRTTKAAGAAAASSSLSPPPRRSAMSSPPSTTTATPASPSASSSNRHIAFSPPPPMPHSNSSPPTTDSPHRITPTQSRERRRSSIFARSLHDDRPEEPAYYDSRAATKQEYRRRGATLGEYYAEHPELLPQLPFTFHRGTKRWRLVALVVVAWIDACVVPIALYYGMYYGPARVEEWIIFAVVTTIWGGPTYFEFAIRTLQLMRKERFYRPLGTDSRWCFDYLTWVSTVIIFIITVLFIVGSAPHTVWLRVLCMPLPAFMYCLTGFVGLPTLYSHMGWPAPFRISSTAKGEPVRDGVYYLVEDTVAVNGHAGRPYREALQARYEASPRFRRMLRDQALFWTIPSFILAVPLTVVAIIPAVPETGAYGVCWGVPFIWGMIWGVVSLFWVKRELHREKYEWEHTKGPVDAAVKARALSSEGEGEVAVGEKSAVADTMTTPPATTTTTTTTTDTAVKDERASTSSNGPEHAVV